MKFPSSDHFLNKVNGRKNFRWAFTEYNTAKNGGGRVALSLTVNTVFSVANKNGMYVFVKKLAIMRELVGKELLVILTQQLSLLVLYIGGIVTYLKVK